jgi:hypothetical protein
MHECSCVIYHLYTCIIKKMVGKLQHCCQNIIQYKLVCKNPSNPGSAIPWKIVILTTPWQKKCPPHEPYISTPLVGHISMLIWYGFSQYSLHVIWCLCTYGEWHIYIYIHFESIYDLPSPPSANEWFFYWMMIITLKRLLN